MNRLALALMFAPIVASLAVLPARGGELPEASPEAVGLSAAGLDAMGGELRKLADDGKIAGGVALVARRGKVAFVEAFGSRDLAEKAPMTPDAIFAIASMTKPITCVATMQLVEAGKLGLDDPVGKHLPELANLRVLGPAEDDTPEAIATVPAERPVTIRDLLSHTSGISYGAFLSDDPRLGRAYARAGVMGRGFASIAEQVAKLADAPLAHQPGERWTYGLGHDVLGRVIEVVSGQPFDEYLQEHIFGPLDMTDTGFSVPEAKRGRMATIYRAGAGGALDAVPRGFGSETFFAGGAGLFSTARDYARFAQMLLDGGELDGARIIKPETLALMTANQIGEKSAFGGKYGLGFGLEFRPGPDGEPELARFSWGGLYSTDFWVDPAREVVAVLMTQVLPTNSGGADRIFRRGVEAAIED